MVPVSIVNWNTDARIGACSRESSLSSLDEILSGPSALLSFRFYNFLRTPSFVMLMGCILGWLVGEVGGVKFSGSD